MPSITVITPTDTPASIPAGPSVFLAGAIDQGMAVDWQSEVIAALQDRHAGLLTIFNPRRAVWPGDQPDVLEAQIRWELRHLDIADTVLVVLPKGSMAPISLLELGLHLQTGRCIVVCDPEYRRAVNVRVTMDAYGWRDARVDTLDAGIDRLCARIRDPKSRVIHTQSVDVHVEMPRGWVAEERLLKAMNADWTPLPPNVMRGRDVIPNPKIPSDLYTHLQEAHAVLRCTSLMPMRMTISASGWKTFRYPGPT
jgi:hypothetical protein